MRVIKICPYKAPKLIDVEDSYESFRQQVGGWIERIFPFDDPVAIICNEEGKLLNLPYNRALMRDGVIGDIIAGDFLITGVKKDGNEASLSDELAEKYMKLFAVPEMFVNTEDGVAVITLG